MLHLKLIIDILFTQFEKKILRIRFAKSNRKIKKNIYLNKMYSRKFLKSFKIIIVNN